MRELYNARTGRREVKGVRFTTVATFDVRAVAESAKVELEESGIAVMVSNGEVSELDGSPTNSIRLRVPEEDVMRALVLLKPFLRQEDAERPLNDEELERQALSAMTEDDELARVAANRAISQPADGPSERDKHASRALWCLSLGLVCLPAWMVGMYSLLTAAFRSGPISPAGRFNLKAAAVVAAITAAGIVFAMTRAYSRLNP
jgi:hypothetical protein